ncbi:MAG: hypothetical protein MI919_13005 [Holophagales bacterium]|nr:hypothetical protein [Holophagales bacterium]
MEAPNTPESAATPVEPAAPSRQPAELRAREHRRGGRPCDPDPECRPLRSRAGNRRARGCRREHDREREHGREARRRGVVRNADLFRRCLEEKRDEDWRCFLGRCGRRIRGILGRTAQRFRLRLRDGELDDLAQDLYLNLLRSDTGFRGTEELELWAFLVRSCRNLVIDHWRYIHASKRQRFEVSVAFDNLGCVSSGRFRSGFRLMPLSSGPNPEERLLRADRRRAFVLRCREAGWLPVRDVPVAGRLIPRQARERVLAMVFVDGLTSQEVSAHFRDLEPRQVDSMITGLRRRAARAGTPLPTRAELGGRKRKEWLE